MSTAMTVNWFYSLMAPWMFNPFTGNFDYYRAGSGSSVPATAIEFIDGTFMEFVDGSGYAEYIS